MKSIRLLVLGIFGLLLAGCGNQSDFYVYQDIGSYQQLKNRAQDDEVVFYQTGQMNNIKQVRTEGASVDSRQYVYNDNSTDPLHSSLKFRRGNGQSVKVSIDYDRVYKQDGYVIPISLHGTYNAVFTFGNWNDFLGGRRIELQLTRVSQKIWEMDTQRSFQRSTDEMVDMINRQHHAHLIGTVKSHEVTGVVKFIGNLESLESIGPQQHFHVEYAPRR